MVNVLLDNKEFMQKPKSVEVRELNNRIIRLEESLAVEELALEIVKGKSFVPATFKSINGVIRRTKEYWKSQEVVALDFDDGMTLNEALKNDFFQRYASFLYTTFSHTEQHNKFRVVFVLSEVITNYKKVEAILRKLMEMFPQADKSCKDATRLFFGGTKLFVFDYSNQLNVIDFIDNTLLGDIQGDNSNISPQCLPLKPKKNSESDKYAKHIDWIINGDMCKLQEAIQIEPVQLKIGEFEDFLKKQDLRKFLGIESQGSFYDIFHEENSPSGSIFKSAEKNNHQLYKCHSNNYPFIGNILDIVKKLKGFKDIKQAKEFLIKLYKIQIEISPKDKELIKKLERYNLLFSSEKAEEEYPNLFKVLKKHNLFNEIQLILNLAIEYVGHYCEGKAFVYVSTTKVSKLLYKSPSVVNRNLNMLTLFKLINKLKSNEIPNVLYQKLNRRKKMKQFEYLNNIYEVPKYTRELFEEIEGMCKKWLENGCTSKTINFEGVLRTFGEKDAKRVYPQIKLEKLNRLSDEITLQIHKVTMYLLEEKGWTTEKEILDNINLYFKGQNQFKKNQFKLCISEMLEMYDLEFIHTNKVIKDEMKITENDMKKNSFPKIIRHKVSISVPVKSNNFLLDKKHIFSKQMNHRIIKYFKSDFDLFVPLLDVKGEVADKGAVNYVVMTLIRSFKLKNKTAIVAGEEYLKNALEYDEVFGESTKPSEIISLGIQECKKLSLIDIDDNSKQITILNGIFDSKNVA